MPISRIPPDVFFLDRGAGRSLQAQLRETVVEVVAAAMAELGEVELTVGEVDVSSYSAEKGVNNVIKDGRDPWIVDEMLGALQLTDTGGDTVATIVSWGNHPEAMSDENNLLTSDFVHALRETVESGPVWESYERSGVGGVCLYLNAAVGGMMTPLGADPYDLMGNHWTDYDFDMVKAIGDYLAYFSLESLASGEALTDPELRFRFKEFQVPVENQGYWLFLNLGVLNTEMFTFEIPDPDETIGEYNMPLATTEVGVIELGPIEILTIPGEMLPELGIGGYDGSHTGPLQELIDESNNPLDITQAPAGPYLADLMDGEYNLFFGLANDELGYIIPPWQYELGEPAYLAEAEGDHYEETNSVGPQITPNLLETAEALLAWVFPE